MFKNAPGSFALFGGSAAAKSWMQVGEDGQQATWTQDAIASSAGAISSITVAQPLDVIKVRSSMYVVHLLSTRICANHPSFNSLRIFPDENPEQTIRLPRIRGIYTDQISKERRRRWFLQGTHPKAYGRWTKTHLFVYDCTAYHCIFYQEVQLGGVKGCGALRFLKRMQHSIRIQTMFRHLCFFCVLVWLLVLINYSNTRTRSCKN